MPEMESTAKSALEGARIFFLDLGAGRILSARPDGSDLKVIVAGGQRHPDGLATDPKRGHLYWTNMGNPVANDGSIFRSDLDGGNITVIVPPGSTFTPKQLQIEAKSQKLYWCDREGMRVMRCNLDGTEIETLVQTGESDADRHEQTRWCVGIAVDAEEGKIYWTQKGGDNAGQGRIFRAGIDIPAGQGPEARTDIELLFADLPEPIDLDIDPSSRMLYWTDRGDPPRGNTVNRASMDITANSHAESQILITHLMEGIGLALDPKGERMFVTDLAGSVYSANLDGTNSKMLLAAQGNLAGITYVA
jgi:DNA-binding beta-propeller fold protein YncE